MAADQQFIELYESFIHLTRQGGELLDELLTTLELEQQSIQQRDLSALENNTLCKQQLLLNIESNINDRNSVITQAGFSPSEEGLKQFMQQMPESSKATLSMHWDRLSERLFTVRAANTRNEQILVRSKQNVDQLLSILQGHQSKNILYDPAGGKGNYAAQRSIGKA